MKNKNKKIALDVDGVLLNFYQGVCEKFNKPYITIDKFDTDWIDEIFPIIENDMNFWSNLKQMIPPCGITFDFDYYITALPSQMVGARLHNLVELGYPVKPIYVSHDKAKLCKGLGVDILIDDKPKTIIECRKIGVNGILIVPPYFSNDYFIELNPVRSLDEAKRQFDNEY